MTYVFIGKTLDEAKAAATTYLDAHETFGKVRLYTRETTGGGVLHIAEITVEDE